MYLPELRQEISQGDLFDNVSLLAVAEASGNHHLTVHLREGRAILLTHDCEFDKPGNPWVLVAEVCPLSEIPSGNQGHIRQYRTRNTFYLEPIAGSVMDAEETT